MTERFSTPIRDALAQNEYKLGEFGDRLTHLLSVEHEFIEVTRRKPFHIYHDSMWQMLLGETDMPDEPSKLDRLSRVEGANADRSRGWPAYCFSIRRAGHRA